MLLCVPIEVSTDDEISCHICQARRPAFSFTLGGNGKVVTAGLCRACEEHLCRTTAHGWIKRPFDESERPPWDWWAPTPSDESPPGV